MTLKEKATAFIKKYETPLEVAFFVGGFLFDIIFISDPDDMFSIAQQAVYLFIIATLIHYEMLFRLHKWRPKERYLKLWSYRDFSLHFLLGSLLSVYSLLYIKSASILSSFIFLSLLVAIILINELSFVKSAKVSLKVGFFAICVFSFFSVLYPIALGFVGWTPFLLSTLSTVLVLIAQIQVLERAQIDPIILKKSMTAPSVAVLGVFALFYFLGWIPPVPLSVKAQGVYHKLEKHEGEFVLSFEKTWQPWQDSDKEFKAAPGDVIYFYAQIYSPARITDKITLHWQMKDKKGIWQTTDRVPLTIQGGRKEGFRGYAVKANYQPGEWRVSVETNIGTEISRYYFEVIPVAANPDRNFTVLLR
ncbi:DUF2914 domain-containing protein [Bdellovibrio sp. qaytius]|nr:DUF2914 domain-containing protein [Bdellovibrio sp. qaytius]